MEKRKACLKKLLRGWKTGLTDVYVITEKESKMGTFSGLAAKLIKMDGVEVIFEASGVTAAARELVGEGCQLKGDGLSGMKAGQAIVACGRDLQRAMELFQQLADKNAKRVIEYSKAITEVDQKLG